jgi:CubicO group peptidase (beta-lactamase class C family)
MKVIITMLFSMFIIISNQVFADEIYFPPLTGSDWEKVSPESLNWNTQKIEELYKFLDEKNSKAFIVLKDGKIVIEKYFDSFTKDSVWYWASAGKTLTSALVGIAQEEGLLSINDITSKYLGEGWTSCLKEKEDMITIRHQLTMTTGLDYQVEDLDCTNPECLKYKADAGTQWYYHNAAYTLLENVVVNASGLNYNTYYGQKIRNLTGINGLWIKTGFINVFYSVPRSMARYGILMLNKGVWNGTDVIKDKEYLKQMTNTSQGLNKSYGYLWWLNGKDSYMIPGLSKVFIGDAMPDAPYDMFAALGKNGQILNVAPSKGIVVVRMGDRPDDQFFISNVFNNQIWQYLNEIMDGETSVRENTEEMGITPNPASEYIEIRKPSEGFKPSEGSATKIYNTFGEIVMTTPSLRDTPSEKGNLKIDISHLPVGLYFIQIGNYSEKFMVVR